MVTWHRDMLLRGGNRDWQIDRLVRRLDGCSGEFRLNVGGVLHGEISLSL